MFLCDICYDTAESLVQWSENIMDFRVSEQMQALPDTPGRNRVLAISASHVHLLATNVTVKGISSVPPE